ncbi:MAG: hypothetical protein ACK40K_01475 [Raineya sp.]
MKNKLKKLRVLLFLLATSFFTDSISAIACTASASCANGGTVSCSGSHSCHAGDGFVTCTNHNGSSNTASCGGGRQPKTKS